MTAVADYLPLAETQSPADQATLVATVAAAHDSRTPIYPLGGCTSLNYGLSPSRPGIGISLGSLNRVLDYPARDMTITAEAGVTLGELAKSLAAERQWLPVDAPQAASATLGGLIATSWSGARRYGHGTMRDYVIGISAVDGRGKLFKAGGRVVKNVAGYDFCKLLTGSCGTLGVITQVTLKIKPMPESSAFLFCDLKDWNHTERLLSALVHSAVTPAAIELLLGPHWASNATLGLSTAGSLGRLAVGLEGTFDEVRWMLNRLAQEWDELGITTSRMLVDEPATHLWNDLAEFSVVPEAPLVIKASVRPSRVTEFVQLILGMDRAASLQVHAGNGIIVARFDKFEAVDISRHLIGKLQPAAELAGGHVTVLSSCLGPLTRQAVWGASSAATPWMRKVKDQFDPRGLLNPGRFVYDNS